MRSRIYLLLLLATPAFGAYAGDAGYVPKAVDLLERPAADAKPVGALTRQQALEVVGRNGNWVNVKAGALSGWLRMIDVRLKTGPHPSLREMQARQDAQVQHWAEQMESQMQGIQEMLEGMAQQFLSNQKLVADERMQGRHS